MAKRIRRGMVRTAPMMAVFVTASVATDLKHPASTVPAFASSDALIEFEVWDPQNKFYLGVLQRRDVGSSFTEELNQSGTAKLNLNLTDPILHNRPYLLADRNIIRVLVEGTYRFAYRVQGGSTTLVSSSEYVGEEMGMAGPGLMEILKDARLEPDFPIEGDPTKAAHERRFGYMSPYGLSKATGGWLAYPPGIPVWYEPSKWTQNFVAPQKQTITNGPAVVFPERWPDAEAGTLWITNPNDPAVPGTIYLRGEFTLAAQEFVGVYAACDNRFELYLDDIKISDDMTDGLSYTRTTDWTGTLAAGHHLLAAKAINDPGDPGGNFAFFLATVMRVVGEVPQTPALFHTDVQHWRVYFEGNGTVPYTDTVKSYQTTSTIGAVVQHYYTVVGGDTLTGIGKRYGIPWQDIYNANKAYIDNDPRISRLPTRPPAWWIFPGMVFAIPGRYDDTTQTVTSTQYVNQRTWQAGTPLTTPQPGWLPYQILAQVVWEAKGRDVLALRNLDLGFGQNGLDSNGDTWPSAPEDKFERAFGIGDSVYDVAQELIESGMDIRMMFNDSTGRFELQAFIKMGVDRGVTSEKPFKLFDVGHSLLEYEVERAATVINDLLIQTDDGWRRYSRPDSITLIGRTEGNLSVGGVDPNRVLSAVGGEIAELSSPKKNVTARYRWVDGRKPYTDFDLGDTVVAVNELRREFNVRITSISVEEADENQLEVTIEASGEDSIDPLRSEATP